LQSAIAIAVIRAILGSVVAAAMFLLNNKT
jgi:hypothetical protein